VLPVTRDSAASQVAVITGAARGIGRAVALSFAAQGSPVVIAARSADALANTAADIERAGGQVLAVTTDVRDEAQVTALMERAVARFGRIDVLVCGAATPVVRPTIELSLDDWNLVIATNLTGTFLCVREAGKHMLAQRSGRIVTFGAVNGILPFPERLAHATSKAGVIHLTKALAAEWTPLGVTVNCVVPGWTRTEVVDDYIDRGAIDVDKIEARTPARRMAEPDEIVRAVMFLSSPDAGFVSGQPLIVDGGWTIYGFYE